MCPDAREEFERLKKQYTILDLYLSYRAPDRNKAERLADHLYLTAEATAKLDDHAYVLSKLLRRLEKVVSGRDLEIRNNMKTVRKILTFVTVYHDIGKGEVQYQLYAHHKCDATPPHNYSSVVFLLRSDDIRRAFIEMLLDDGLSLKVSDLVYMSCLTAIAMHHEYYDYRDIAFIDTLTPLTLSLSKRIPAETTLLFDESVADILKYVANKLGTDIPSTGRKSTIVATLAEALEYIVALHYEFGASLVDTKTLRIEHREEHVAISSSLAEVLTWILAIADNIAAKARRPSDQEASFFASLVERYYG